VALLGDAAHAMEPNLGQGEAQAIEDAEALLVALRGGAELVGALVAYTAARRKRARMFQQHSSRFARLALSTHTRPRDLMMRLSHDPVRRRVMEHLLRRHASASFGCLARGGVVALHAREQQRIGSLDSAACGSVISRAYR
jgi:2-polyprenyl-6-methoxyphenol hydroxylase-like FAD-dependent oxidoreductase